MRFVYDNIAAIYVALVASLMGWLFGGTRADVLLDAVPWLLLFMVQVLFFFPQKREGESTFDARERLWYDLKRDPVAWTVLGLLLLLCIPFVNNGLCVNCDWKLIREGFKPDPPIKFLPFCVNRMQHLNVFLWFATALSSMLVVRHGLARSGKRLVLEMIVWNGFALAILGFVQIATEAVGPFWQPMSNVAIAGDFFSTFGYPNMAGDYFTVLTGLALALWRQRNIEMDELEEEQRINAEKSRHRAFWRRHVYLMPAGVFAFAAISTLSRAAMILVSVLLTVIVFHSLISMTHRLPRKERIATQMKAALAVAVVAVFAVISIPDSVQREIDTLDSNAILMRVSGKGQYHVRVSTALWKAHPLFGCGGWGYKHFCIPMMTDEELKSIQKVGGINVHNDYLQFLAEHGLVGFGAMVAIVVLLLIPVFKMWKRLVKASRFADAASRPPRPAAIFAFPASAFCILFADLTTLIHCFGDCPLRSPAVLTLFFVSLASIPGFLPKENTHASR